MKKVHTSTRENDGNELSAKLDAVIELLEDLFILQALSSGVGRDHIRAILGVHTTRITKINKGVKQALKNGKEEA